MDAGTRGFWALVLALLSASIYFGMGAEGRRAAIQKTHAVELKNGDIVSLVRVVDGDSLVVATEAGDHVAVRVLGITLESPNDRDPINVIGAQARRELEKGLKQRPLRVLLNDPPQDSHGRTLCELFMDERNVGLDLVQRGLVLVYTVHPFPAMSMYLAEQEAAKAARRGVWGDPGTARRAALLSAEWRSR